MASIGLKIDHSSAGTDLANTLAKALYGDPADAIANAKLKSQLMNDALERQYRRELITKTTQEAIAASMDNKRQHDIWLAANDAADITQPFQTIKPQASEAPVVVEPGEQSPAAAATPAAAAANAPPPQVLGTEPDWEYRVNNYPLVSDRDPVPISFDVPPGLPSVEGVPPDLLAPPPPMPPLLSGVPSALQPPPEVPIPSVQLPVSDTPRDLQLRPVVGGSQPVVGTGTPVIGNSPPVIGGSPPLVGRTDTDPRDPLSRLVQGLLGYDGPPPEVVETAPPEVPTTAIATPPPADYELPVPIDAAERAIVTPPPSELGETLMATPPPAGRLSDEFVPPPAVPLVLPTEPGRLSDEFVPPPLPGTAPGRLSDEFVPPPAPPPNVLPTEPGRLSDEYTLPLEPVPVGETEIIKLPGREVPTAVSPETTAATTPAAVSPAVAPAAGQPPAEAEATAAPAPNQPAASATATTPPSPPAGLPQEVMDKLNADYQREEKAIRLSGGIKGGASPEAVQQALMRLQGKYQLLFDQAVKLSPTEVAATLAAGGAELSKTSAATAAEAGEGRGGYEGTGIESQDHNTITGVMGTTGAVAPDDARAYALAWTRQFGTPRIQRIEDENGNFIDKEVMPRIPQGVPSVEEVYRRAGLAPAAAAAAAAEAAPAAAGAPATAAPATVGAAAGAPATAAAGAPATAAATGTPATTPADGYIVKRPHEVPTDSQGQNERYLLATTTADADLSKMTKADLPGKWEQMFSNPTKSEGNIVREMADMIARENNPKLAAYWGKAMDFATAILRDESGAATRPEDMKTVIERYIPTAQDSDEVIAKKAQRRKVAIEGLHRGAFPGTNPQERMASSDAYLREKLGEDALDNPTTSSTSSSPAPTDATTVPTVKNDADYNALPGGTVFIGPDGKRRTKPKQRAEP